MFRNVLKLKFLSVFPKLSYPERKISLAFPLLIANMGLAVMVGQHCTYDVVMVEMVWSTFIIFFANVVGWGARIQLSVSSGPVSN